jgi:outer membrane protein assembly factor BamD (BamD/ComL family)
MTMMLAALVVVAACNRGPRVYVPAVDPELVRLSKEQVYAKAEDAYGREKWQRARTYYSHVYETYPNDPDAVNLVEAQYKYRDFINRYPTSEQADYAMLRIAMTAYRQMEKPDRDQQKTREALEKFDDMLRTHPNSPLKAEAEAKRQEVLDRLAKHEHLVARFYIKRGSWTAAVQRLNYLIDTYPHFSDRAGAFYDLGTALARLGRGGEARLYFERVVTEFPQSEYAERAKQRLGEIKA